MITEAIEFSPVVAEWMHRPKARKILGALTLGAVIFGVTLSILHQSGLGALYLMAKAKLHPLWYSEFLPILFFASSIFAGLSMVIFEGTISHRVLKDRIPESHSHTFDEIVIGLARGAAIAMFVYYFFKLLVFLHDGHWVYLDSGWGVWYMVEVIGFVLVPCFLFAIGARNRNLGIIRIASIMTLIGIVLNRLNVSVIAFNWYVPNHYYPSWMEIVVTLMIISIEIWVFRWVVTRMPVFEHGSDRPTSHLTTNGKPSENASEVTWKRTTT
jgi:Ni/Fe-hydrogenase subunit HybB-like protein